MLLFETVLVLLPPATVLVLKRTLPPAVATADVDDPRIVHLVTVSFEAPLMKRIVLVLAVAEAVVLESVSELPPLFKPSMVTLLAPARSTKGLPAAVAPVTVRGPTGLIVSEAQLPAVGAFNAALAAPSSVLPTMVTRTVLPVWLVLALSASKAAFKVT
jgi:hypothetical protein